MQYRKAAALMSRVTIDPTTGRLRSSSQPGRPGPGGTHELVCFVGLGRARTASTFTQGAGSGYAEFYHEGRYLGRSYLLADTAALAAETRRIESKRKAAKTATRVVIKEGLAEAVAHNSDDAWGELVRIILIGLLEQPDTRHWHTLPRWLHVARFPCPPDLDGFDVVLKNAGGYRAATMHVTQPLRKHRNTYVSFCRSAR
jgi:hypothetical protein